MNQLTQNQVIYGSISLIDLHTFTDIYYKNLKKAREIAHKYDYKQSEIIIDIVCFYVNRLSIFESCSLLKSIFKNYKDITWIHYYNEVKFTEENLVVNNFSIIFNLQDVVTALVLAQFDEVNFNPDYCFKCQNKSSQDVEGQDEIFDIPSCKTDLPDFLGSYEFLSTDYVERYSGKFVDAVIFYKNKNNCKDKLALLFKYSVKHKYFRFGIDLIFNTFFALKKLNEFKNSRVIIFLDIFVFTKMNKIAMEYKLFENFGIIVSGILCKDGFIDSLDFLILKGHDVVVVPWCEKNSLIDLVKFVEKCNKSFAKSVKIFPWPVIDDENSVLYSPCTCFDLYVKLSSHAIHFDNFDSKVNLFKTLCDNALPSTRYSTWLQSQGLITVNNAIEITTSKKLVTSYQVNLNSTFNKLLPEQLFNELFSPKYTTLIYGRSDAGKGYFIAYLALALATGMDFLTLPNSIRRRVCYFDGEVSKEDLDFRFMQLINERKELGQFLYSNVNILKPDIDYIGFDSEFSDYIINSVKDFKAEVLILDNLESLEGDYSSNNATRYFKLAKKLKELNVSVILVHHTNKEEETYKGPSVLHNLSQNVFFLEIPRASSTPTKYSFDAAAALNNGELVFRFKIEKCKIPGLKHSSVVCHLPIYGAWKVIDGSLIDVYIKRSGITLDNSEFDLNFFIDKLKAEIKLSDKEIEIIKILHKENCYKRKVIDSILEFNSLSILNSLISKNIVTKYGEGRSTCYYLTFFYNSDSLSPSEKMVCSAFTSGHSCAREELENLTGLKKDKLLKVINILRHKGLVEREGPARNPVYRLVSLPQN